MNITSVDFVSTCSDASLMLIWLGFEFRNWFIRNTLNRVPLYINPYYVVTELQGAESGNRIHYPPSL